MENNGWCCPKCGYNVYDTDEFRATGGFFAKVFDVQNRRFTTVTCQQCSYTEIYKTRASGLGNVFDFFTG